MTDEEFNAAVEAEKERRKQELEDYPELRQYSYLWVSPEEMIRNQIREEERWNNMQERLSKEFEEKADKVRRVDEYTEEILHSQGHYIRGHFACRYADYRKVCPGCGKTFYTDNPKRKYDSYRCINIANNARQKQKRIDARSKMICLQCGKEFAAKRKDTKYCCNACRQKAYREKKGLGSDTDTARDQSDHLP